MNTKKLHIVLCDDDEDDRDFFKMVAEDSLRDVQVNATESAEELLQLLSLNKDIDLVFLDLNMPVTSGKECLKLIREESRFNEVPVIIYSTAANEADVEETFRKGANLYVRKPSSTQSLRAIFKHVVGMTKETLLHDERKKFLLEL